MQIRWKHFNEKGAGSSLNQAIGNPLDPKKITQATNDMPKGEYFFFLKR
jgi:hypothetical protein